MARSKKTAAAASVAKLTPGFASGNADTTSSQTKPAGSDAVTAYGGYLWTQEKSRKLQHRSKWVTYDDCIANFAIVASAVRIWTDLGGSAKWTAEPNESGDKNAQRGVDIVTEGLLKARMSKPWRQVAKRQLMKKFRGFAIHEAIPKRRSDGQWIYADLQHRPQWTVDRWDIPDDKTAWQGIEQWTRSGERYPIDRRRLFYSAEDTLTDSPDGVGLLRHVVESCDILHRYQQLEGIANDVNMAGLPLGRAPFGKLVQDAKANGCKDPKSINEYIVAQTKCLNDLLTGQIKTTDRSLLIDSAVYATVDEHKTPSSVYEWSFEVIRGAIDGLPEIATAIGRLSREIARVMSAEFLLLGGEDSGGSYSMHEDKTAMFRIVVNAALEDLADDATRDLAARLIALNGLDPETCTPRLVPEPIATQSVEAACRSLQLLAQAGAPIRPQWRGVDLLLGRMDLPPQPELTPAELGMLTRGPRPAQPTAQQNNEADSSAAEAPTEDDTGGDAALGEALGPGGAMP